MRKILVLFTVLVALFSCEGEGALDNCSKDGYERTPLLENLADNIIIPTYVAYNNELTNLNTAAASFSQNATEENLILLRTSWKEAYKIWQYAAIFEIGKAENIRFRDYTNSFQTNEAIINSNIESGSYNLKLSTNLYAQGFPALDYLINGLGATDAEIVAFYNDVDKGDHYKNYLSDLISRLQEMTNEVLKDWNGSYRGIFISSNCSSETSSLDKITNDFVYNLEEVVRVKKLDKGIQNANKVEARYIEVFSKDLLRESVLASKNFFNGKYYGSDAVGESLSSYLDALQVQYDGKLLSVVIDENYDIALDKVDLLDENFYQNISVNSEKYVTAKNAIEDVVVRIKFEMLTAIGSKIDFSSTDGD